MDQKKLIGVLAGALGVALLALAFLLGRLTSNAPVTERVVLTPAASRASTPELGNVAPASVPLAADPPAVPAESVASMPSSTAGHPSALQSLAPSAVSRGDMSSIPASAPNVASAPSERPALASYFAQMSGAGDLGAGDPQAFAGSLMQSVSSGDFSSFDQLMAKARAQRDRLRGVTPPPSCTEYHRLAVTLSDHSVTVLERMREALSKGDSTALLTLTTEGRAMETQANQLKAMEEAIKRRAGM